MGLPIYNGQTQPANINVIDTVNILDLVNCSLLRITYQPGKLQEIIIENELAGCGYIQYNRFNTVINGDNDNIVTLMTLEMVKTNNHESKICTAMQICKFVESFGDKPVLVDALQVYPANTVTRNVAALSGRQVSDIQWATKLGIHATAYEFTDPTISRNIIHALYTSKDSPLVTTLAERKYYNIRTAAVLYFHGVGTGFISAPTAEQLYARMDNLTEDTRIEITEDIRLYSAEKQYRLGLILSAWNRIYGTISDATVNSICVNFGLYSHIAPTIDTRLDWDGVGKLPIPATDEELQSMFENIPEGDSGRLSI